MDMKLLVVGLPVSDVDVSKAFYVDQVGFHLDHDVEPAPGMRVVQLTPPGSPCSVVIGVGMPLGEPGATKGPQLVVEDIDAARAELAGRGVPITEVQQLGPVGVPGSRFAFFSDPDGNGWSVQEYRTDPVLTRPLVDDDLRRAVRARADALSSGDPAVLAALLHPGYRWTSHRGDVYDREAYVASNIGSRLRWVRQTFEGLDVVVVGDTGLVTGIAEDLVQVDGEERAFRMPVTQTWVRSGDRWLCLAGHAGPAL